MLETKNVTMMDESMGMAALPPARSRMDGPVSGIQFIYYQPAFEELIYVAMVSLTKTKNVTIRTNFSEMDAQTFAKSRLGLLVMNLGNVLRLVGMVSSLELKFAIRENSDPVQLIA